MPSKVISPRVLVIVWGIGLIMMMTLAEAAWANNGPHGNYSLTTDACAGCHRAHTATQGKLLIGTDIQSLCLTCHSSSGTGADTNVDDGVYAGGGDLLGGGFVNYKGAPVTSSHSVDGTQQYAWGSGTPWVSQWGCVGCHSDVSGLRWPGIAEWFPGPNPDDPGSNVAMPLTCILCHDVHGNPNYRMLQQRLHPPEVDFPDPEGLVLVKSFETGGDTPDDPEVYQPDYTTRNYKSGLDDWCTGCHFLYNEEQSPPGWGFDAWDGAGKVPRYRHLMKIPITGWTDPDSGITYDLTTSLPLESDKLFCLTCHLAHGTSTIMEGFAQGVAPAGDSTLLRLDNRGVCEDCHKK